MDFNDIQQLWQQQHTEAPNVQEIIRKAERARVQMRLKSLGSIILLAGTMVFIAYVGMNFDFKYASTGAGIVIILLSILGGILMNSQLLIMLMNKTDIAADAYSYLDQLIRYKNRLHRVQTTGMTLYFLGLSLGFIFYFYEFVMRSLTVGLIAYAATAVWVLFAWFYLRPRSMRKQSKKLDELIVQARALSEK